MSLLERLAVQIARARARNGPQEPPVPARSETQPAAVRTPRAKIGVGRILGYAVLVWLVVWLLFGGFASIACEISGEFVSRGKDWISRGSFYGLTQRGFCVAGPYYDIQTNTYHNLDVDYPPYPEP
jgi:hypothetical protein